MVMECRLHILFSGNCDNFQVVASSDDEKAMVTHCVCVPHFASSGKAVLVTWGETDVDMEVKCLTFDPMYCDDTAMK